MASSEAGAGQKPWLISPLIQRKEILDASMLDKESFPAPLTYLSKSLWLCKVYK